jgi:hypothetical protein
MIVVDLQELEERARIATESIGGVVMEPEALLLIIAEVRRMKSQLGEQHGYLTDMQGELLQLRTELVSALTHGHGAHKKKGKMLKMKVVAKD